MNDYYRQQDTNHAESRANISDTLQKMYESRLDSMESLLEKILLKVNNDKLLCAMADEEIESSYLIMRAQEIIEIQLNNQREKLIQDLSQRLAEENSADFYKKELDNVKSLFENELNQMERDLKKFKRKYEEKVNHNSQLLGDNEKLLEQITDVENRRESHHFSESMKSKSEMSQLHKQCKNLEKMNNELEIQLEDNNRLLALQKEEIAESKYDIKALETIKTKYTSLQDSYKSLQKENSELRERRQSERAMEELQHSNDKLVKMLSKMESKYESEVSSSLENKKKLKVQENEIKRILKYNGSLKKKLQEILKKIHPLKKQILGVSQESLDLKSIFTRMITKTKERFTAKFLHDDLYKNRMLEKAGKRIEELMQFLDISEGNEAALMKVNTKALWRIEELEKRLQLYEREEDDNRYKLKYHSRGESKGTEGRRSVSWHWKSKV